MPAERVQVLGEEAVVSDFISCGLPLVEPLRGKKDDGSDTLLFVAAERTRGELADVVLDDRSGNSAAYRPDWASEQEANSGADPGTAG